MPVTDTVRRKDAVSPQTLAAAPGLALAVGCAAGAVVGGALGVIVMAGASADDDWAAVGALVAGAAVGALVAVGVYVAALVAAARRLFPPGRRARPVLHTLTGQTAVAAYGAALLAVLRPSSMGWTVLVVLLTAGAAACAPAAFVWSGTSGRPRRIAIAAVLVPTLLGGGVVAGTNTAAEVRTGRVAADLPLVLFDRSTDFPLSPAQSRTVAVPAAAGTAVRTSNPASTDPDTAPARLPTISFPSPGPRPGTCPDHGPPAGARHGPGRAMRHIGRPLTREAPVSRRDRDFRGRGAQPTSNRSRFITLSHAATKSRTNFCCASSLA